MSDLYVIQTVRKGDNKVVRELRPMNKGYAEQLAECMKETINQNFFIQVAPAHPTTLPAKP